MPDDESREKNRTHTHTHTHAGRLSAVYKARLILHALTRNSRRTHLNRDDNRTMERQQSHRNTRAWNCRVTRSIPRFNNSNHSRTTHFATSRKRAHQKSDAFNNKKTKNIYRSFSDDNNNLKISKINFYLIGREALPTDNWGRINYITSPSPLHFAFLFLNKCIQRLWEEMGEKHGTGRSSLI